MNIKSILVLFGFFVSTFVFAGIEIPKDYRIANVQPGYCVWVSLEILGYLNDVKKLHGLTSARAKDPDHIYYVKENDVLIKMVMPKHAGCDTAIQEKLNDLKVKFKINPAGSSDRNLLKYANTIGCMVGIKPGGRNPGYHAIVLTHYDDEIVKFYDCNDVNANYEAKREWFDFYWTGLAVVIEPESKK